MPMAANHEKSMDPYERLANAVVKLAVMDYEKALRRIKSGHGHVDARIADSKERCERFFRSKSFGIYTDVDPEWLMRRIKDDVYKEERMKPPEKPLTGTCRNCRWLVKDAEGRRHCGNQYLDDKMVYKVSWNNPCWEWEDEDGHF